ncbi:MAG: response regulator transcription factor [Bacteroidota bacterium]
MSNHTTILIVDDHDLIHNGISDILHDATEYRIIAHAYNGDEAIKKANELNPDIILMDISMPIKNGIEATTSILSSNPEIKIIALSQHEENEYIVQMMKVGCYGYLLKNSRKDEILRALDDVKMNKKYMNPNIIDKMFLDNNDDVKNKSILTRRELEILNGIAEGKTNPEIADSLIISVRTVETHRRNIMQKLKANTVVDLLRSASKLKLIDF